MIQTLRLKLRLFSKSDELDVVAQLSDDEFMVNSPTGAFNAERATERFGQLLESYDKNDIGKLAVFGGASERVVCTLA